jgi:hypothetical protein
VHPDDDFGPCAQVNPSYAFPDLPRLRSLLEPAGYTLRERLPTQVLHMEQ